MIKRLNIYVFRQLLTSFVFAAAAVTFVILFTQSFRLLTLVIDNSSTMWFFFRLMALSVPTFLPLVLPLGIGVSILFVYNKLAVDSELVVMRAVGVSPMRQAQPAIILAVLTMITGYLLTLWIAPAANRSLVSLEYHMRDNFAVLLSRPGNFNDITEGLTFYARARGDNGALEGILMHDVRKPEDPVTLMAERGQVVDNNGQPQLIVFSGRRQEMNPATGQLSQLAFDQYVLDISTMRSESAARAPDPREQTVTELLNSTPDTTNNPHATREKMLAEFNQRMVTPLLTLTYAFIGLAAILAGEFNRRGMSRRIFIAATGIVAVQAIMMSMNSLVMRGGIFVLLLYFVALAPIVICLVLMNMERIRARMPAVAPKVAAT